MLMSKKTFLVTTGPDASTLELQLEMMTKRAANTPVNPRTCATVFVCNSCKFEAWAKQSKGRYRKYVYLPNKENVIYQRQK